MLKILTIIIIIVCVYVFSMCPIVRKWNSQDNFQELAVSFCCVFHV